MTSITDPNDPPNTSLHDMPQATHKVLTWDDLQAFWFAAWKRKIDMELKSRGSSKSEYPYTTQDSTGVVVTHSLSKKKLEDLVVKQNKLTYSFEQKRSTTNQAKNSQYNKNKTNDHFSSAKSKFSRS